MFTITDNIKDDILEIQFSGHGNVKKSYQIICSQGRVLQQGKITGYTRRTCLFVGDLKRGSYTFKLDESEPKIFNII
jgi:GTP-binding protein EngB required for normal cell division